MTERDWLTSTDPVAMLAHVRPTATERQLDAYPRACCEFYGVKISTEANASSGAWANAWTNAKPLATDVRPAIIRCIFGNPWNPVVTTLGELANSQSDGERYEIFDPAWLTWHDGLIPALAASVYERECPKCEGHGRVWPAEPDEPLDHSVYCTCEDAACPGVYLREKLCERCKGSGRLADPDWDVLPMIADPLEEAGCGSLDLLMHLRGYERCGVCVGKGTTVEQNPYEYSAARGGHSDTQIEMCEACGGDRKMQEPGTGWRPLPEPKHVCGCWAVEICCLRPV